jgi:hypothetical protein
MPTCVTLTGLTLDCRDNVGGIKYAYVLPYSASLTGTTANGNVSALSVDGVSVTDISTTFKLFETPRQTGTVTETGTFSEENGTAFYTQVASLTFNKLTSGSQDQVQKMGEASKLAVIVKDNNDRLWLVGNLNGAVVSATNGGTGTAFGDRNGVTVEFTGISNDPMYTISITE